MANGTSAPDEIAALDSSVIATGGIPAGPSRISPMAWYTLAVLSAVNFFAYLDRSALSLLLQPIKTDLHLSDQQLGLLTGLAFALFYAILGVPLARFADRSSRTRLISACLVLWSIMTALSGAARNFIQLFLARVGVGVGEAGCVPPAHSIISDYFPRDRRALAITIFQSGAVVGLSAGLFAVSLIADKWGWRIALAAAGFAGLPLALLSFFTVREPKRPQPFHETKEPSSAAFRALLGRPAFVHLALAYSLGTICTSGMTQWMPSLLIRSFGMTMAEVGAWSGLAGAIGGVAGLLTGGLVATWLVPRNPRWEVQICVVANIIYIPLYIAMILSPTAWLALTLKTVANYVAAIAGGLAVASVQSFAEPHRRATAVSIVFFLSSLLGMGFGPYLIGVLSDLFAPSLGQESLRYAMLATVAIVLWSIVHFQIAANRSAKDRVN